MAFHRLDFPLKARQIHAPQQPPDIPRRMVCPHQLLHIHLLQYNLLPVHRLETRSRFLRQGSSLRLF